MEESEKRHGFSFHTRPLNCRRKERKIDARRKHAKIKAKQKKSEPVYPTSSLPSFPNAYRDYNNTNKGKRCGVILNLSKEIAQLPLPLLHQCPTRLLVNRVYKKPCALAPTTTLAPTLPPLLLSPQNSPQTQPATPFFIP